ncbi:DNA repair recombination rad5c [Fusarium napiforme]|uniref:DNA repair recombination rad5c n=1 Tax=Fusarium napiforme TaxID=42672 RepID=A0A8H5MU68_9HYPO|nr:DNA repair recombination rad5c [Fusarium napiforme]
MNYCQADLLEQVDNSQNNIDESSKDNIWNEPFSSLPITDFWETIFQPDPSITGNFFDGTLPIIDTDGAGTSWGNMQEWADSLFHFDPPGDLTPLLIEDDTEQSECSRLCCYGMVPDVPIKLVGDMRDLQSRINPCLPYQMFTISKQYQYFMLKSPDGGIFAQINELASKGIAESQKVASIEIMAFIDTKLLQHVFSRAKRPGEATLKVEVNFYGSVDDAELVGDKLCSQKMFLQDPEHGAENVEYRNPHVIRFPGIEEPTSSSTDQVFQSTKSKSSQAPVDGVNDHNHVILSIYQSLVRSRDLDTRKTGNMVRTALLPHQAKAVSFMMQREQGPIPPEFSLWSQERNVLTTFYRHRITGAESTESSDELGGGILADDMGMGKSLMPSTLIMNSWEAQIALHIDKSIKTGKYYGKDRNSKVNEYLDFDIVFTTYHTIAYSMNKPDSLVFRIKWFRIILDEAHMIRRRETTLYQAASQLSAAYRWCLTATPIQNHLEDLGSLLGFLRISELEHKAAFRKHIVVPFSDDITAALRRVAILLDSICLRRTQELLHLPQVSERHHYIELQDSERRQYDQTLANMACFIRGKASLGPGKRNGFGIFQAQLQLRLLCNHGTFQKPFKDSDHRDKKAEREDFLHSLGSNAQITCSLCGIPIPAFDLLGGSDSYNHPCGHKLCQECILQNDEAGVSPENRFLARPCPLCKGMIEESHSSNSQSFVGELDSSHFDPEGYSSKMNALIQDLEQSPVGTKSIVFSCWTRTLDLVSVHLRQRKIPFQRIDGGQVLSQRQANMDRFVKYKEYPILLMSTGVGAFGLNLTAASYVYIMEPQWNPSVESQAIGRVARLGQNKEVTIVHYIVRGTVEVKMHSQQIRKLELAKVGFQEK